MDEKIKKLENEYVANFRNPDFKNKWEMIPVDIRELIIKDMQCKPYDRRDKGGSFRITDVDDYSKGFVFLTNIKCDMLDIHMLPTPCKTSPTMKWYTKDSVVKTIGKEYLVDFYSKPDGSNNCIRIKKVEWQNLRKILPLLINWSKDNQEKNWQ